jgi:CheY-like chemotaxis protein
MNPMFEHKGAGETILIVEDNASARMALEALLDALGYKVIAAADAIEALESF